VNVARFLALKKETDAAKPMDADLHAGPPPHLRFG
jgi:hypothetical protein